MLNFKKSIKIISPQQKSREHQNASFILIAIIQMTTVKSRLWGLRGLWELLNHIRHLLSFTAIQNPSLSVNNQAHSQRCQKSLKQAHHKLQPQKSPASFSHTQRKQQTHYIPPFQKRWAQTRNHTLLQGCVDFMTDSCTLRVCTEFDEAEVVCRYAS